MIARLIAELRRRQVPVGLQEALALAQALSLELHENSLEKFYFLAKSLLIHDESHMDDFEQVFRFVYRGIPMTAKELLQDFSEWLKSPIAQREFTEEEKAALQEIDIEELKRMFEERMKEQTERHDGGNYWIGTGGTSPFGTGGYHPSGISLRQGNANKNSAGGRSVLQSADPRRYQKYRNDLVLDTRQIELALRKLKTLKPDGPATELDLEKTIDATARNFGELDVVLKRPAKANTRVILLMDVGGSMDPYAHMVSQLFSAAKKATHWKELRCYYFHNCVYGRVFKTEGLNESVLVRDLFRECDERYKLILVGDAAMAPYELMGSAWATTEEDRISGLQWLIMLRNHFQKTVWLNPNGVPEPVFHQQYRSTTDVISQVFPMLPLTLQGLEAAVKDLR